MVVVGMGVGLGAWGEFGDIEQYPKSCVLRVLFNTFRTMRSTTITAVVPVPATVAKTTNTTTTVILIVDYFLPLSSFIVTIVIVLVGYNHHLLYHCSG